MRRRRRAWWAGAWAVALAGASACSGGSPEEGAVDAAQQETVVGQVGDVFEEAIVVATVELRQ